MEDNNYSKLKGKLFIPIAHTEKANIYKYNNVVIKKYHKDTSEYIMLDHEVRIVKLRQGDGQRGDIFINRDQ